MCCGCIIISVGETLAWSTGRRTDESSAAKNEISALRQWMQLCGQIRYLNSREPSQMLLFLQNYRGTPSQHCVGLLQPVCVCVCVCVRICVCVCV